MNVLMIGVDKNRLGGMWSVAENYLCNKAFNEHVNLTYIATSTSGTIIKRFFFMLVGFVKVVQVLSTKHIDIVHIHMAEKGSVFRKGVIVFFSKLFKKKVIVQMHAGPFMDWYYTLCPCLSQLVKMILNEVDLVFALGEYWKKQLKEILPISKIEVLYNGSFFPSTRKYNNEGKYIMFLGMLTEKKGVYDLIKAIKIIDNKLDPSIKVLLCGKDSTGEVEKLVLNLGLNNRIQLMGWISREQRDELFDNTLLCVLPSYSEALSMTVIESMCYGIPIVTTNITTMPELVGNIVKLVTPGDIISLAELIFAYLSDNKERERMSILLYKRAQLYFSNDKCVNDTLNFYNKIINKN